MATRRRRHRVDQRPVTLVLAFDQDDWLARCDADGYEPLKASGFVLGEPFASADRDDGRALRVVDHIDATTALGHEVAETDRFAARGDADNLRRSIRRQLRPRAV
jgi:hypothetical protein